MNKVRITFWAPDGTVRPPHEVEFTSEEDAIHFRIEPGIVEVKDGNIVLAVYANMPVVAQNMDDPPGGA